MNIKSPPLATSFLRNLKARAAILGLATCLSVMSPTTCRAMEAIDALNGVAPMNAAELEESYGGFILPNGVNVNIGIETDISVNGNLVVRNYYSSGKIDHAQSADIKPTASLDIKQLGATTKVYNVVSAPSSASTEAQGATLPEGNTNIAVSNNPLTGSTQTMIINSADKAVISQVQKITIDISNYAAMAKQQAMSALAIFRSQARTGAISAIR